MLLVTKQQGQGSINNILSSPFKFYQGLRQGDPLSSLLFAIVMDPFNRTINYHIKRIQVSPQLAKPNQANAG
ncbi:unnamed protein product [Ambrosiozyma monospora]|uniref:Unnamed protein product n=1 Tax=Ambrosiozyma monospora TaxID=43982 RepID=A0ACB5SRS8_AMBMO|nr:unnamed protein product [Ambrosiozyma monospora]